MSGEGLSPSGLGTLTGVLTDTVKTLAVTRIYTGTFTLTPYVINQMVTIIVPYGVIGGVFVCLFHKWTKCPVPLPPPNVSDIFVGIFTNVQTINDTIVAAVIARLEAETNRPHLVKELAAILIQQLHIVQQ